MPNVERPRSAIPDDQWVTMPQYGGMQYMFSPPNAWNEHDDGVLKMRKGDFKIRFRIEESIIYSETPEALARLVWAFCRNFYEKWLEHPDIVRDYSTGGF
jgi:hypothetical protein